MRLLLILDVHVWALSAYGLIELLLTDLLGLLLQDVDWLHLDTAIVLALACERIMLWDNVTISVSNRRTATLVASTNPVIVGKFVHIFDFVFNLSLLTSLLFLLPLGNLRCQLSLIFTLPLFPYDQLLSLNLSFQSNCCHAHPNLWRIHNMGWIWRPLIH